jgi:NADP-dependent 3-hydroxy acid dehydrogenase YdfG
VLLADRDEQAVAAVGATFEQDRALARRVDVTDSDEVAGMVDATPVGFDSPRSSPASTACRE